MQKLRANWWMILMLLVFLAILAVALQAYFSRYSELTSDNLDDFIRSFGGWSFAVFSLAYLVSSPIPFLATILAATGGLLFGALPGAAVAVLLSTATSLVPFSLSRRMGREWVAARLAGSKLGKYYQQIDDGNSFTFVLLLRLVPILPWELQNYVAGVTRIAVPPYLVATIVGSIPMTFALAILGAAARKPGSWEFFGALLLTALALLVPASLVVWRRRTQKS